MKCPKCKSENTRYLEQSNMIEGVNYKTVTLACKDCGFTQSRIIKEVKEQ